MDFVCQKCKFLASFFGLFSFFTSLFRAHTFLVHLYRKQFHTFTHWIHMKPKLLEQMHKQIRMHTKRRRGKANKKKCIKPIQSKTSLQLNYEKIDSTNRNIRIRWVRCVYVLVKEAPRRVNPFNMYGMCIWVSSLHLSTLPAYDVQGN